MKIFFCKNCVESRGSRLVIIYMYVAQFHHLPPDTVITLYAARPDFPEKRIQLCEIIYMY